MRVKDGVLAEDLPVLMGSKNCRRAGFAVRSCSVTGLLVLYRSFPHSVGSIPCLRSVDHGQLGSELKVDEQQGKGCDLCYREHEKCSPDDINGTRIIL